MALLHAKEQGWEGYREKVPPGIWASPDKPKGYLRKSVLRTLARRVHDEDILPSEILDAECFDDTDHPTGTEARYFIVGIELGMSMRQARKPRDKDSEDSDEE